MTWTPRGARSRGERGAVAVEAALVTPLLLLVLFGIIEMSTLLRDHVAVSSAVRVGSRVASASPDAGPGICAIGPLAPPCTPQTSPAMAQAAADAIQKAGTALPKNSIDYILVYKANDKGYPGSAGATTMPSTCAGYTSCVRFTWQDSSSAFRYAGGTWDSRTINACLNESDTLGVYMRATHPMVSGLFGTSVPVGDRSVMKFEPLPTDACKPGTPQAHP